MNDTNKQLVDAGVAVPQIELDADGHPVLPAILDRREGDKLEAVVVQTADEVGTNTVQ